MSPVNGQLQTQEPQVIPAFRPNPVRPSYSPIRTDPVQLPRSAFKGPIPPHKPEPHTPPKSYKKPKVVPVIVPKRKRVDKKVRFAEIPDSRIGLNGTSGNGKQIGGTDADKGAFWNSFKPAGAIDLGDTKANKLALNSAGDTLYATGLGGTHVVPVTSNPSLNYTNY
jgi:hypothetical protein